MSAASASDLDPSYASPSFVGSSLWLVPDDDDGRLASGRLFHDASGVRFDPHVTLIAGLRGEHADVVARVEELATRMGAAPLPLRVDGVGAKDLYFQCVYGTIAPAPALLAANAAAREVFGRMGDAPFMPHMSAVYGLLDGAAKAPLLERVRAELVGAKLLCSRISVWATQGTVPEWYPIAVVSLVGEPTRWVAQPPGGGGS